MANNLRDIPTDREAGKRTLAVRLGEQRSRVLLVATVVTALLLPAAGAAAGALPRLAIASLAASPLAIRPLRIATTARGRRLVTTLGGLARLDLVFAALLTSLLLAS